MQYIYVIFCIIVKNVLTVSFPYPKIFYLQLLTFHSKTYTEEMYCLFKLTK